MFLSQNLFIIVSHILSLFFVTVHFVHFASSHLPKLCTMQDPGRRMTKMSMRFVEAELSFINKLPYVQNTCSYKCR